MEKIKKGVNEMKLLNRRAQSTGEYAILFAIVLGAVIAMQNYVRNRIAGGLQAQADAYETAVSGTGLQVTRKALASSEATATMTEALTGVLGSGSLGHTTITNPE